MSQRNPRPERAASHTAPVFVQGLRDGIPIGLGYFAVSFSLGIVAKNAGLTPLQGLIAGLLTYASAGEYATFTGIAAGAGYLELALLAIVINARYLLMSSALSQRVRPEARVGHRILLGSCITDEIFGITIARDGYADPKYSLGAFCVAVPLWGAGTAFGVWLGELLPAFLVTAFGVALYGMFLAAIIPPSRKNKTVLIVVLASFLLSAGAAYCPGIRNIPEGYRTIILTLVIAALAAVIAPVKEVE